MSRVSVIIPTYNRARSLAGEGRSGEARRADWAAVRAAAAARSWGCVVKGALVFAMGARGRTRRGVGAAQPEA